MLNTLSVGNARRARGLAVVAALALASSAAADVVLPPEGATIPPDATLWDTFAPLGEDARQPGVSMAGTRSSLALRFEGGEGYLVSDHDWRFTEDQTVRLFNPSSGRLIAAPWLHHQDEFHEYADHRIFRSQALFNTNEDTRFATLAFGKQDARFWDAAVRFQVDPQTSSWRVQIEEDPSLVSQKGRWQFEGEIDAGVIDDDWYKLWFEFDTRNLTVTGSVNDVMLFENLDLTGGGEHDFTRVVDGDWDRLRNAHFGVLDAESAGDQITDIAVTIIPEPASLALIGMGGLWFAMRRRRR